MVLYSSLWEAKTEAPKLKGKMNVEVKGQLPESDHCTLYTYIAVSYYAS
jgi:hypothetical protein